ncbi:hypothetical protein GQ55_7G139200 [Panicum hallii var. hallii]|uniref:Plastid lipid-associated protein/fibrillin conserved domain-containing protein n=1 Tax=Panicum hallii var. hallii TaxID=1504633 RepID=A0A2T7CUX9_9POAL|nr:hypothetical protein GQ55_7G139200 [Panicum hallii var. hallii]
MAATVLVPPAHCHRATAATTSGRGGAGVISHCTLPPARRRRGSRAVRAAAPPEQSGVSLAGASGHGGDVKAALHRALEGVDRGIFGMTSAQRSEVHRLVELLESRNPTPEPTAELREKVDGCWKLIYSTISILGKKRTKLGLRDFISLGDFLQIIDVEEEKAVNVIKFSARALKILSGKLTIEASYSVTSKTRVDIKLESSTITPEQLMNIFQKNYDMLLAIFNPEGWLEITYVDESLRIGRDDKENIFVLQRADPSEV